MAVPTLDTIRQRVVAAISAHTGSGETLEGWRQATAHYDVFSMTTNAVLSKSFAVQLGETIPTDLRRRVKTTGGASEDGMLVETRIRVQWAQRLRSDGVIGDLDRAYAHEAAFLAAVHEMNTFGTNAPILRSIRRGAIPGSSGDFHLTQAEWSIRHVYDIRAEQASPTSSLSPSAWQILRLEDAELVRSVDHGGSTQDDDGWVTSTLTHITPGESSPGNATAWARDLVDAEGNPVDLSTGRYVVGLRFEFADDTPTGHRPMGGVGLFDGSTPANAPGDADRTVGLANLPGFGWQTHLWAGTTQRGSTTSLPTRGLVTPTPGGGINAQAWSASGDAEFAHFDADDGPYGDARLHAVLGVAGGGEGTDETLVWRAWWRVVRF